jgi:hypothetical protein
MGKRIMLIEKRRYNIKQNKNKLEANEKQLKLPFKKGDVLLVFSTHCNL